MPPSVSGVWMLVAIAGCGGAPARTAAPPPAPAQAYEVADFEPCCCLHGQYGVEALMPSECEATGGACVAFPRPSAAGATASGNINTCAPEASPSTTSSSSTDELVTPR